MNFINCRITDILCEVSVAAGFVYFFFSWSYEDASDLADWGGLEGKMGVLVIAL